MTQKDMQTEHAKQEDVYTVGVVAEIKQIVKMQNHVVRVIVESKQKAELAYFIEKEEFLKAQVVLEEEENVQEQLPPEVEEAMLRSLQENCCLTVLLIPKIGKELKKQAEAINTEINEYNTKLNAINEEAEAVKAEVAQISKRLTELEPLEKEYQDKVLEDMMKIPNIIDPSVPIGKDDTFNVENEKFGEPVVPDFEIPYHTDIMERFDGIDLDAAGKVAGNGFYYLMGDIARLHSAMTAYARDFMIGKGFTYCIPPFMIRSNVVTGVMSFEEMDAMMYKIEGEDLYLIGTSEHSMIGKFIDTINDESKLPYTLTSYSPCFRKEKGAHGIEERGVYRIHQFEKQEMIVVCNPEDSKMWFDKLWQNTVDLFRSLDIPVRTLECCSGDLADLKVKSLDVEAWSPRQKKYFEVGSCSNLGDAQARRLKNP